MRRGNREAVMPPLRTLAAYPSQKSLISLDGYSWFLNVPFSPPKGRTHPFPPEISPFFPPKGGGLGEKEYVSTQKYLRVIEFKSK
jgi:hypothetical protein